MESDKAKEYVFQCQAHLPDFILELPVHQLNAVNFEIENAYAACKAEGDKIREQLEDERNCYLESRNNLLDENKELQFRLSKAEAIINAAENAAKLFCDQLYSSELALEMLADIKRYKAK